MARRLVVAGAGVIGLCAAVEAARRGFAVTVVEREGPVRDGCSFRNAGLIVPSHFVPLAAPGAVLRALRWMWNPKSPFHLRPRIDADLWRWALRFWRSATGAHVARAAPILRDLHLASRAEYVRLAREGGLDFGLEERGLLLLCRTDGALEEESRTAGEARRLGIPAEVLAPGRVAEIEPGVTMNLAGAVFYPRDCHLDPARFMRCIEEAARAAGVAFRWNESAEGWRTEAGRVAALCTRAAAGERREIRGDEFLIAAGAWSSDLARGLGLRLPLQAGRGYSLTLDRPRQRPALPAILAETYVAVTPLGSSLRFGGTMEIADRDAPPNPVRVEGIIDAALDAYPAFRRDDFAGVEPWMGRRPVTPDGLPYVGRSDRFPNLLIAAGHAMMGMSLGPATAILLADLLEGRAPAVDVTPLRPERFE